MLRMNKNNQEGLASIFISMIMMIVITLLVLGFVQFANKEASQVLNRQLSTAAFYVAESGVNEVEAVYQQNYLQHGFNSISGGVFNKSSCTSTTSTSSYIQTYIQTLNSSKVAIPCLLVSIETNHLRYSDLARGSSWITPINGINGTSNIRYLTIGWQNPSMTLPPATYCFGSATTAPQYNLGPQIYPSNCDAGVIKVDLVPGNSLGTEYTYYFYPQPLGGKSPSLPIPYSRYKEGIPLPGDCTPNASLSEYCNVTLSGLNYPNYYIRIKSFYLPANIEICAENSNPSSDGYCTIPFQGDQIVVDSTGKVSNVLQRIRVNLAPDYNGVNGSGIVPNSALNITQGICKQFYYNGSSIYQGIGSAGC